MSEQQQPRIAILGATLSTPNLGVSALATGAVKCALAQFPGAEVYLLDYSKHAEDQTFHINASAVRVPLVPLRFSKNVFLPNNIAFLLATAALLRLVPSQKLRDWVFRRNSCLRQMRDTSLFASLAGGDSFSDIYGMQRLLYVALPQILVLLLGKKLVLLPQTIGPFKGTVAKDIARFILRGADRVCSRELRSVEELKKLIGPEQAAAKLRFCYDVAFVLDPALPRNLHVAGLPDHAGKHRPLVGVNVSGLLSMGGYSGKNMFGLRADYRQFVRELFRELIENTRASVLLVPHVYGSELSSESDSLICEKLFEEWKDTYPERLGIVRGAGSPNEIKAVIGQCDFFIGSRMHACIAALSQGVPAVCVAYSDKFIGVMETIGVDCVVADARTLDLPQLLAFIAGAFERRIEIHDLLVHKMREVKPVVLNLFGNLEEPELSGSFHKPAAPVEIGVR